MPEKLEPNTEYVPALIIVDRMELQQLRCDWEEHLANEVRLHDRLDRLIKTGTTPTKE